MGTDLKHFREHCDASVQEMFAAVVYLDAACYLPYKARVLAGIHRIMNPGPRLLLVDWCRQEGLHRVQEELVLHPFLQHWAVPGLETIASYRKHRTRTGSTIRRTSRRSGRCRSCGGCCCRCYKPPAQQGVASMEESSFARPYHPTSALAQQGVAIADDRDRHA